jgi:hypothetical protein
VANSFLHHHKSLRKMIFIHSEFACFSDLIPDYVRFSPVHKHLLECLLVTLKRLLLRIQSYDFELSTHLCNSLEHIWANQNQHGSVSLFIEQTFTMFRTHRRPISLHCTQTSLLPLLHINIVLICFLNRNSGYTFRMSVNWLWIIWFSWRRGLWWRDAILVYISLIHFYNSN